METSGSVDISAMTAWLITHGYMLTSTVAATTLTALSAGFEVTETAPGGSTWTYTNLTFENHTGGGGGQAPVVTTSAATGVTTSAATLNGTVNPQAQSTAYHFEYGTTSAYGTSVPVPDGDAGSGSSAVSESANLTGLSASTTYHYRLDATNATGTTNGADQSFTTSAPAGGSVSFGASSGAKKCSNCTSLSWTHTVSGTNPALLVETAVGGDSCVLTAKDGTTTLTRLATVHDNNQTAGYQAVWGLAAPPAGANAITVTATGCSSTHELTGGSLSFTGASQSAPFGAPVTAAGSGAISVTTAGSTTGNMIAGFASNGAPINSATSPATSRYIANQDSNTAAGNSAGATRPATGSGVTMAWSSQSDWWGATAVEVLAG
jgi:hypothetical protein